MSQIAAAGRTARAGAVWEAPDLAIERARCWGQVSAAVFRRGSGGGVWRSPWHRLVLSPALVGPVALSLDGGPAHRFTAQPGTLAFCPAGTEARAAHGPGRMIQVLQDPLLYRGLVPEIGGGAPASLAPLIDFTDPLIAQIARSLASEVEHGAADRLLVDGLSTALAVRIARRFASWRPPDPDARGLSRERLRRVLDHIEAHLGGELALADLAAVACLSPFHFSRCFKRAVGVGPQRYVVRRRVERARDMIRRTDEPLAAVAQALGFADQSHFTHVFRRETGETPARFRTTAAA
jgi:AraC family transcriptional regulator